MKIGVLLSRVRVEEKWLFEALDKRGVEYDRLDDREIKFDITQRERWQQYDAVLERSISFARGLYATQIFNAWGVPTVNDSQVAAICGDKLTTTLMLEKANVPQPLVKVAFTTESALATIGKRPKRSSNTKRRWVRISTRSSTFKNSSSSRAATSVRLSLAIRRCARSIAPRRTGSPTRRAAGRAWYAR